MATYTNRPICKACQLAELKKRGLVVNDDNKALEYLGSINYFRFACYLQPFEVNSVTHQYIPGTSFDEVVKLCQFDSVHLQHDLAEGMERGEPLKGRLHTGFLRQIRHAYTSSCMEDFGGGIFRGALKDF
jgi:hypothetical protein